MMKKFINLSLLIILIAHTGFSQKKYSLFFSSGYDYNINYMSNMKYQNSNNFPDYNLGIGGAAYLNDRVRLRAELKYVNTSFSRQYDFETTTASTLSKSVIAINSIDVNPYLDYRFFSICNFDLYGYSGFRFEFNMGDYQYSNTIDGDKSYKNYIESNYKKAMAGLTGGFSLNYNLTKKLALSISPEYTYFLNYLYSNNKSNLERINVNLGVEWKF